MFSLLKIRLKISKFGAPKAIPQVHGRNNKIIPIGFSYLPMMKSFYLLIIKILRNLNENKGSLE